MALYNLQNPDSIISPQLGAISGGNMPKLHYSDYVESMADALPALENVEYNRKVQEEEIRLNNEAREQARRDANIALGLKGIETGIQVGTNPILQKYGSKVLSALMPKALPSVMNTSGVPASISSAMQPWASQVIPQAPNTLTVAAPAIGNAPTFSGLGTGLVSETTPIGYTPSLATTGTDVATQGTGILSKLGSGVSKYGGSTLATFGAGYGVSSMLGEKNRELGKLGGLVGNANDQRNVGGAMSGAMSGAAIGSIVPGVGTLIGAGLGAIGGIFGGKGHCIIISSCCGGNSEEANIARQYRDKFFTREILRGYYAYSEGWVELMERYSEVKEYVKKTIVDPLLRVARFKLNLTKEHPSTLDCATAANLTNLWHDMGASLGTFTRNNGEIV